MIPPPPGSNRTYTLLPYTTLCRSRSFQSFQPCARLGRLLDSHPAGDARPILLSIGEPKNQPPGFIAEEIAAAAGTWSSYPPPRGSDAYRIACAEWLTARYDLPADMRSEEHTSELQSLMRISYAVFCLKKKTKTLLY